MLVGGGANTIEVIDLKSPNTTCKKIPNFPATIDNSIGGLGFQNKPIICGGFNDTSLTNKCYTLEGKVWTPSANMNKVRYGPGFSSFPSKNQSQKIIVIGGWYDNYLFNGEVLTERGWELFPIPFGVSNPCQTPINSTTLMMMTGGRNTYFFNTEKNEWSRGPPLNDFRFETSCALIKRDSNSQEWSIIVAGGLSSQEMASVEILDAGSNAWRRGPDLPLPITDAQLVEGQDGGVVLIGGVRNSIHPSTSLYQLPHAGPGAVWTTMKQELKEGRFSILAFLVPDSYC